MQQQKKIFFPNLDGLRFICFLLVFLFHCYKTLFEGFRTTHGTFYSIVGFLFQNGELGVNFFFVLSGFLITFLLIKEVELTGSVHLGSFYLRRVLRIWPLFYLCVLIGFIGVPLLKSFAGAESSEAANPWYYIFFINNFDYIHLWPGFPDALILIVLWSVAVEEQFYLLWPVLLKYIPRKVYPFLFGAIIIATLVFRSFYTGSSDHAYAVRNFHTFSVIGDMAFGALLAYYCSREGKVLHFISNLRRWQIAFIYAGAVTILLFRHSLFESPIMMVFERIIIAIFFGLIIVEQNFSARSFFKFSAFKQMSRLGIYTYGLYCLHFFVISLMQSALPKLGFPINTPVTACIATIIALVSVTILAILSYRFFEKPFLQLKNRYSFIIKG